MQVMLVSTVERRVVASVCCIVFSQSYPTSGLRAGGLMHRDIREKVCVGGLFGLS